MTKIHKNTNIDYNEDYYEHGVSKGISGYMHYRWMPEMTLRMAHHMIQTLGLKPSDVVLDFGCAKGFLVHAMRILDIPCFGVDISEYAISRAPAEVRDFCKQIMSIEDMIDNKAPYDWIVSKDVLEHLHEPEIDCFLEVAYRSSKKLFIAVPLGGDDTSGKFIIPSYDLDKTHVTVKSFSWWQHKCEHFGWQVMAAGYSFPGMKENWVKIDAKGNAFFTLENPSLG